MEGRIQGRGKQLKEGVVLKIAIPHNMLNGDKINISKLLLITNLVAAGGEARRLIQNRGLRLDGELVVDESMQVELSQPILLQKGRNTFALVWKG